MHNLIEQRLRLSNCDKLRKDKTAGKKLTVLLKNADKTDRIVAENLYGYVAKDWIAPCSSETHLLSAVYALVERLTPSDPMFAEDRDNCVGGRTVLCEAITTRYLLGLAIPQHLVKYIDASYL